MCDQRAMGNPQRGGVWGRGVPSFPTTCSLLFLAFIQKSAKKILAVSFSSLLFQNSDAHEILRLFLFEWEKSDRICLN